MKGHTRKYRSDSYSWDTEAASYDATIYTSGGVMASVYVTVLYDDKPAQDSVKTFKTQDAARSYVEGLREMTL